jgi:3-hydroxyisobutyrate dehydrogenase-like beta-hydroxyacid dehydrogenase
MKISFLGLGIMGSRMANNLIEHGVSLTVWNRSEGLTKDLITKGAKLASTPSDAVLDADIVFSMLSKPEAVEAVFFGEEGALESMKEGAIWADCSTVNPSFSRRAGTEAEQQNVHFMDTPVAGSKAAAAAGNLVFFCGGDRLDFERAEPFMEMMGNKAMHLGKVGQGASLKMLVNVMLAQSMAVFSETILLGEKLGLDRDMLLSMLPTLPVIAPFTKLKAEAMRTGDYSDVNFPLEHMHKDVHLATLSAYEVDQPLHMANACKELFSGAKQAGMGRLDFAALHKYLGQDS